MKILQFITSLNAYDGGTASYMQLLSRSLGSECELHLCALTPMASFVPLEGCQLHSLQTIYGLWTMRRRWLQLLDEIQPDVVHFNGCWMPQTACLIFWTRAYARRHISSSMRLFLTVHGMLEPWVMRHHYWTRKLPAIWLYQKRALAACDVVIATSESEREHLLALGWNDSVAVVPNGLAVDSIPMKQVWTTPRRLLFMSRLHPKKGLPVLLEALSRVEGFELDIVGEGDPEQERGLECSIVRLGLSDRVHLCGPLYGEEKWEKLRLSDLLVLPSYSENYGLVVAESLASGTPVITTTATPWKSIQESGCGWWIQPDVEALVRILHEISLLSAEEMERLGRRSRQLAETQCPVDLQVRRLYDLYRGMPPERTTR